MTLFPSAERRVYSTPVAPPNGVDLSGICHDGARPRRAMILTSDEVSNAFSPLAELVSVGR